MNRMLIPGFLMLFAGVCSGIVSCAHVGERETVFLSDLQESAVINIHGGLGRDRTYWGFPLTVQGITYRKGLVTHPGHLPGYVEYVLRGDFSRFLAMIAILDDARHSAYIEGSAVFEVEVDGRIAYRSSILRANGLAREEIEVDIAGANRLRLRVSNADGFIYNDHAAWINARLVR